MAGQQPLYRTGGTADAAGELSLAFRGRDAAPVRVTQVTVEMDQGGAAAICTIRLDGALISPMVPTGDAAVGEPPIWVEPGSVLTAEWTGADPGSVGALVVIWDYGPGAG